MEPWVRLESENLSGKKKSTLSTTNFWGPEIAGWGGGLAGEWVGVEKSVPSLESLFSLGFDVPRMWPGCPGRLGMIKKFVPKTFMLIFRPLFCDCGARFDRRRLDLQQLGCPSAQPRPQRA